MNSHSHQPGTLKQSNKKHKGSLSSKRSQKRSLGAGKVSSAAIAAVRSGAVSGSASGGGKGSQKKGSKVVIQDTRAERLNRNQQIKKQKRADTILQKRLGSSDGAPKVVGIVSLSKCCSVETEEVIEKLLSESSWHNKAARGEIVHAVYAKHKTRCTFLNPSSDCDLLQAIDISKVADIIIFVVRVDTALSNDQNLIDDQGHTILSALKAVGCPEILCCLQGMENLSGKKLVEAKQSAQRQLESAIGPDVKIIETGKPEFMSRQLCNITPRVVAWKASRSYMIGDEIKVASISTAGDSEGSIDKVSYSAQIGGFLRGKPLPVNSLIHIVGVGTCRVDKIISSDDPFPGGNHVRRKKEFMDVSNEDVTSSRVVIADVTKQDPLFMEAESDGLSGEQTWPTEAEMDAAMKQMDEGAGRHRRNIPAAIPDGMSSYQADWFVDEEGVFDDEAVASREDDTKDDLAPMVRFEDDGIEDEDETFTMAGSMLDAPFASGKGHAEKQRLRALANNDVQFPDEMDTPDDRAARERFARYRALQSFRSSPWHPKENLPREYSRIFQFENFSGVQRRILAGTKAAEALLAEGQEDDDGTGKRNPFSGVLRTDQPDMATDEINSGEQYIFSGQYVSLVLDGLTATMAQKLSMMGHAMIFALHMHENRMSVLHFNVRRFGGYDEPIKSKESLIFQAGFRSFSCNPIFSESNLNCDKHKLERFLLHDRFSVATTYAPITFLPCPLLVFKKLENGETILVATGSLSSIDPDRIVLKKVILTGLPVRVRKRFGVVKHLFYDPQDVRWFKPAELVTKFGLRGHIREPVGTHGLLKAIFSGPITQNDTVMLILYKRVFPKLKEEEQIVVY